MSEKAPRKAMTDEAKEYRKQFDDSSNKQLFDSVSDLVDDRFQITKNDRLQNKAGVMVKTADGESVNIGGRFAAQSQLEDIAAFEDQIRLGVKAKEVIAALPLIDAALASAYRRATRAKTPGKVNELSVIRLNLVVSKVFTAQEVGNMTNDEITTLLDYARIAKAQSESPAAPVHEKLPSLDQVGSDTEYEQPTLPSLEELGVDTDTDNATEPDADVLPSLDQVGSDAEYEQPTLPSLEDLGIDTDSVDGERAEVLASLEQARSEWARISSKRQRRTFDRRIEGYNAVQTKYNELVQQYGRLQLAEQLGTITDQTEKNRLVISYLANEQNELRDLVKHESDAKWSYKFARWMNEGSRKKRLAKGVMIGLVVGTGGSLLAGAAGATVLAGGAVAASRFVRGYTARHTEGMNRLDTDAVQGDVEYRRKLYDGDDFESNAEILQHYFETDSKKEQAKRRHAFYRGAGSVVVGAIAGHVLHMGIDRAAGWTDHNHLGGHPGADHHAGGPAEGKPPVVPPEHPGNGGPSGGTHEPPAPKPGHDLLHPHDVYSVHPGEGWNETMQDMGIPEDKWADVLKDAGPKLHEQGWSYYDNAHHEWRISRPGTLSKGAVEALKSASAENGFTFR
jgi:hypothetical protein